MDDESNGVLGLIIFVLWCGLCASLGANIAGWQGAVVGLIFAIASMWVIVSSGPSA